MGKLIGEGITFDDVLLVPAFSEVIANDVDTRTRLTNKIQLYSTDECQYGYCYRTSYGNRNGRQGGIVLYIRTCQ